MSNKARLKKKNPGYDTRSKAQISPDQRSVLSQTLQTAIYFHKGGNFQQAEEYYRLVLAADSNNLNANKLLGNLYEQTGNIGAAVPLFEKVLQAKPDDVEALDKLGYVFYILGRIDDSITIYSRLMILKPNSPNAYLNFSLLTKSRSKLPASISSPDERKNILINCLKRNDIVAQDLFPVCFNEVFQEDILEEVHEFISSEENPESYIHSIINFPLSKLFKEQLFFLILEKTFVTEPLAETFLTRLRKGLAMLLAKNKVDEQFCSRMMPFVYAMAQQCFLNEYVFQTTEAEKGFLAEIRAKLRDANSLVTPKSGIYLALLACYAPLDTYYISENLPENLITTNRFLAKLIRVHFGEPRREKELLEEIKSFSEIRDEVSHGVKQQYEDNPYPRWIDAFLAPPISFIEFLRKDIAPNSPAHLQGIERPEVLIAGCGTGKQPITSANSYLNASVVAIDLSRASLSYAKRKAEEFGVNNIEFIQGDILELPKLDKTFDIIECSGVLHHMSNPEDGFRILLDLLKPTGYMKIGLYSELARKEIVAAQNFARDQGFAPTLEGIREFRQAIFALSEDKKMKEVTCCRDFYSTSAVRDLIFHVQEHRFTLPEISRLLADLNLEFLGFVLSNEWKNYYLAQHADDPGANSLAYWHSFEMEHPELFAGMYNFWVCKKKSL